MEHAGRSGPPAKAGHCYSCKKAAPRHPPGAAWKFWNRGNNCLYVSADTSSPCVVLV